MIEKLDCLVAVDECYYEYHSKTIMDLVNSYDNLLVLRSFSKTYGLAGLRIGYIAGNSTLISTLNTFRLPASVNRLAQVAALAALENYEYYENAWKSLRYAKELLSQKLISLNLEVLPSETNFVFIRTSKAKKIFQALWDSKISVFGGWDASEFSGLGTDYLRITVGTPEENSILLKTIKTILDDL